MFQSLDDSARQSGLQSKKWTRLAGGIVVAILLLGVILAGKIWPQTLKNIVMIAGDPLHAPLPPQAPPPQVVERRPVKPVKRFEVPDLKLHVPSEIPTKVLTGPDEPQPPVITVCVNCQVGGVPIPNGPPVIGIPPETIPAPPSQVVREVPPIVAEPPRIVRIGGQVTEGLLVSRVTPQYPQMAKITRVQGTVRFMAVIGRDGRITDLEYISGPALLVKTAQDAVAQWRYRPYLLNGQPVEVITEISVNFVLGQ